jgi:hypothetical protein
MILTEMSDKTISANIKFVQITKQQIDAKQNAIQKSYKLVVNNSKLAPRHIQITIQPTSEMSQPINDYGELHLP